MKIYSLIEHSQQDTARNFAIKTTEDEDIVNRSIQYQYAINNNAPSLSLSTNITTRNLFSRRLKYGNALCSLLMGTALLLTEPVFAASIRAVVEAGRSGIVGSTTTVTGSLAGPSYYETIYSASGFPGISTSGSGCTKASELVAGFSQIYGFKLTGVAQGATEGAVLLAEGIGTWQRTLVDTTNNFAEELLIGTVVFTKGLWINNFNSQFLGYSSTSSYDDGLNNQQFSGSSTIVCPTIFQKGNAGIMSGFEWKTNDDTRRSTLNVRFLIDAPSGGMRPGRYTSPRLYFIDSGYDMIGNNLYQELFSEVEVVVANYSCSINTQQQHNIELDQKTSTVAVGTTLWKTTQAVSVICNDNGGSESNITPWLSIIAAGKSAGDNLEPLNLGVAGTDGLVIRGAWDTTQEPTCGPQAAAMANSMYFDGRDGVGLKEITVNSTNVNAEAKDIMFVLCKVDAVDAGDYEAQATISVVQR
ncbi:hypothetical protein [Serratia microhaemolytica]|uniref:hypothetical protein n=1 Tax=Serratia microhaemolytica TaxID=2675110 RepID=UPI000FDDCB92|nr:hypothetical protein [Serratia microhaemolytica]